MEKKKNYFVLFITMALIYGGIMCLFDWKEDEFRSWYFYCFEGGIFGVLMVLFEWWVDKRRAKKNKKENNS